MTDNGYPKIGKDGKIVWHKPDNSELWTALGILASLLAGPAFLGALFAGYSLLELLK